MVNVLLESGVVGLHGLYAAHRPPGCIPVGLFRLLPKLTDGQPERFPQRLDPALTVVVDGEHPSWPATQPVHQIAQPHVPRLPTGHLLHLDRGLRRQGHLVHHSGGYGCSPLGTKLLHGDLNGVLHHHRVVHVAEFAGVLLTRGRRRGYEPRIVPRRRRPRGGRCRLRGGPEQRQASHGDSSGQQYAAGHPGCPLDTPTPVTAHPELRPRPATRRIAVPLFNKVGEAIIQAGLVNHAPPPKLGRPADPARISADMPASAARPRLSCDLTVPTGQLVSAATSFTSRSHRWWSTIARRCAAGICRSASTSSTWWVSGGGAFGGRPWRRAKESAVRTRRHRLTASRQATVRTHASGAPSLSSRARCSQARTKASWTTSCASARSPIMAYSWPMSRPTLPA